MQPSDSCSTPQSGAPGRPWLVDDPIEVGGRLLRGRLFVPAHQCGLAVNGRPGDRYIEYHRVRAASGAAMQITGATPVAASPLWGSGSALVNYDDSIVPGYQRLARAIHEEGGTMLAQLAHAGPTEIDGRDVIGPSAMFSQVSRQVVREATVGELDLIVSQFSAGARRCREGGLDGIEVTLAHGLLLAAFLSPLTNRRHDAYGGSLDRRVAFPLRVIRAVREAAGQAMIVGVRLVGDDLVPGGIDAGEAARIARLLEPDVDYINVIAGNNNFMEARIRHWPPAPAEHGLFRRLARAVREVVNVPVCTVGRITTPELANDILVRGDADLVGTVRAAIADPAFIRKARVRATSEIRPCVGCNLCIDEEVSGRSLRCSVNPTIDAFDIERPAIPSTPQRSVLVVGGGVAGLEVARREALHGRAVTLLERSHAVGGQTRAWASAPSRAEFLCFVAWQQRELERLGVSVKTGIEATPLLIRDSGADVVILATGSLPADLVIPSDGTVAVPALLNSLVEPPAGDVVVCDTVGSLDAALVAERFAASGRCSRVTLVSARPAIGDGNWLSTVLPMVRSLGERGVEIIERAEVTRIADGSVELAGVLGEARGKLRADALVAWVGGIPQTSLATSLDELGVGATLVGDVLRPRRVADAIADAASLPAALAAAGGEVASGASR